mmetsp:Transcript_96661/g.279037  ORF Transcript_96661/g.279037 Transcript_96661/m.279037 type:complete len:485 (+) Transcript_96661:1143-2597(+)
MQGELSADPSRVGEAEGPRLQDERAGLAFHRDGKRRGVDAPTCVPAAAARAHLHQAALGVGPDPLPDLGADATLGVGGPVPSHGPPPSQDRPSDGRTAGDDQDRRSRCSHPQRQVVRHELGHLCDVGWGQQPLAPLRLALRVLQPPARHLLVAFPEGGPDHHPGQVTIIEGGHLKKLINSGVDVLKTAPEHDHRSRRLWQFREGLVEVDPHGPGRRQPREGGVGLPPVKEKPHRGQLSDDILLLLPAEPCDGEGQIHPDADLAVLDESPLERRHQHRDACGSVLVACWREEPAPIAFQTAFRHLGHLLSTRRVAQVAQGADRARSACSGGAHRIRELSDATYGAVHLGDAAEELPRAESHAVRLPPLQQHVASLCFSYRVAVRVEAHHAAVAHRVHVAGIRRQPHRVKGEHPGPDVQRSPSPQGRLLEAAGIRALGLLPLVGQRGVPKPTGGIGAAQHVAHELRAVIHGEQVGADPQLLFEDDA